MYLEGVWVPVGDGVQRRVKGFLCQACSRLYTFESGEAWESLGLTEREARLTEEMEAGFRQKDMVIEALKADLRDGEIELTTLREQVVILQGLVESQAGQITGLQQALTVNQAQFEELQAQVVVSQMHEAPAEFNSMVAPLPPMEELEASGESEAV